MCNYKLIKKEEAEQYFYKLPKHMQIESLNPRNNFLPDRKSFNLKSLYWLYEKESFFYLYPFIFTELNNNNIKDIQSHYPFGQPLYNIEDDCLIIEAFNYFHRWVNEKKILVEFIKFHPGLNLKSIFEEKYQFFSKDLIYIDLKSNFEKNYSKGRLSDVKKAQNFYSLKVRHSYNSVDFKIFYKMYLKTMTFLNAKSFYFFSEKTLNSLIYKNCQVWIVYNEKEENLASAMVFINKNSKNVEYFLAGRNENAHLYKASSFLIHKISEFYKKEGFEKFFLGGGLANNISDNLLKFKKGFSKNIIKQNFGYKIYDKDRYYNLKNNKENNMVIFYREPY